VKLPQAEAAGEWHTSSNGPISLTYKTSEFLEKSCHRFVSTDLDFSQLELKWTSTLGLKPKIL
jgi:hypothetical protein